MCDKIARVSKFSPLKSWQTLKRRSDKLQPICLATPTNTFARSYNLLILILTKKVLKTVLWQWILLYRCKQNTHRVTEATDVELQIAGHLQIKDNKLAALKVLCGTRVPTNINDCGPIFLRYFFVAADGFLMLAWVTTYFKTSLAGIQAS